MEYKNRNGQSIFTEASPYRDDFDESKGYTQLLGVPGKGFQAREFTQAQTTLLATIKRLSEVFLKDGNVISGMGFAISSTTDEEGKYTLTVDDGRVYVQGIVHNFKKQSVKITKSGVEAVGVKISTEIVTELTDPSLKDPAEGSNFGQEGAHRLKQTPYITINDPEAPIIYRLEEGVLMTDPTKPQVDLVGDILASRTYDESGNYKVSGYNLWTSPNADPDYVTLTVDAGKAYILGYPIHKPASSIVRIPKSRATRTLQNESQFFRNGQLKYKINFTPVKDVLRVQAEVRVTKERKVRGSIPGGIDTLDKSSVSVIERVWKENPDGSLAYEYQPAEYSLINQNSISWASTGQEPDVGSTYYVTYKYDKTMEKVKDYSMTTAVVNGITEYYVDFTSNIGDDPIADTRFFYDYEFYLARKDLISLDKNGYIIVTQGQPDLPDKVTTPISASPDVLYLGTITLEPNSSESVANSYAVTRLSMEDLQKLSDRVGDLEYNQAVSALDREVLDTEPATDLKGIFSDGFTSTGKADFTHPDFSIAYDLEEGMIYLPDTDTRLSTPTFNSNSNQIKLWGRLVTAPFTEEKVVEQAFATRAMLVNPYNVFNNLCVLNLTPAVDNWIDEEKITLEKNNTATYSIRRWWYHGGVPYYDTEKELFNKLSLDKGQTWGGWGPITGTISTSSAKTVLDESVQFMRQRTVTITGENYLPNADNLECYFDGKKVNITALAPSAPGTMAGTIKADATGKVTGTIMIPEGVRCGTREVVLKNANNTGISAYTAQGRRRVIEETIFRTRVTVSPYDPLAQSFQLDSDRMLSSVGLYFASKDPVKGVTVQIRDMVNGYPGTTIHSEVSLSPSQILVSADASLETRVSFKDPILLRSNTQYCTVILSDVDTYTMWVASLGEKDVKTGETVVRQPYLAGTLFASANALTWTALQTDDLKFNIYAAKFNSQGTVEYQPLTGLSLDRIVMFAEYLTPQNTGCTWEVRIKYENESIPLSSKPYEPISNYVDVNLPGLAKEIQLRATFDVSSDGYVSPVLAVDGFNLVGFLGALSGAYVSRNVTFPTGAAFTTVKQSIEFYAPGGSSVSLKFSTDGGTTWRSHASAPVVEQVDASYVRHTYTTNIGTAKTNFRVKVEMTSPNSWIRPKARKLINICR